MFEVALILYLCQSQNAGALSPPSRRPPEIEQPGPDFWPVAETSSIPGDRLRREADYEEREFAKRFNALITALSDFASNYNADHTMNVKKVKAIEKAWHQLEKSDWFRQPKGD